MSEILLARLASGDEIIAKEVSETDSKIVLGSVRMLLVQSTGNGQFGIAIVPWMAGAPDDDIEIDKSRIVAVPVNGPPDNLVRAYLEQTSGIQLATGKPPGLEL